MAADYPGAIVSFTRQVNCESPIIDEFSVDEDDVNGPQEEIEAIETELGINPAGSEATVAARLTAIEATSTPTGMIVMWSGTLASIPTGWSLCDGSGGTPNLLNRFVMGVPDGVTDPGGTGGSHSVTLTQAQLPNISTGSGTSHNHTQNSHSHTQNSHGHTIHEGNEGEHSHSVRGNTSFLAGAEVSAVRPDGGLYWGGGNPVYSTGGHIHGTYADGTVAVNQSTGATNNPEAAHTHSLGGSGSSHENRPLYYQVAYIIKD